MKTAYCTLLFSSLVSSTAFAQIVVPATPDSEEQLAAGQTIDTEIEVAERQRAQGFSLDFERRLRLTWEIEQLETSGRQYRSATGPVLLGLGAALPLMMGGLVELMVGAVTTPWRTASCALGDCSAPGRDHSTAWIVAGAISTAMIAGAILWAVVGQSVGRQRAEAAAALRRELGLEPSLDVTAEGATLSIRARF